MPNAVHLVSHVVNLFKNETDPDAVEWSYQDSPEGDPRFWVTDGSIVRVMTGAEVEANLDRWKQEHIGALVQAAYEWGEAYTPQQQQTLIKTEYARALAEERTNAAAVLQPAMTFSDDLTNDYRSRYEAVKKATTSDEVFGVSLDFSTIPHPPYVSVSEAVGTPD